MLGGGASQYVYIYIHIYWFYIQYTQYMYIDKIRNDMSILRYTLERRLRECKDKGDWLYSWIDCFCWRCCCDIFSLFSYCFTFVLKHSNFIIIRHIICTYHDHETKNIKQHHHDLHPWKSRGIWLFQLTTDCLQISIAMVVAVLRLWHWDFCCSVSR